MAVNTIDKLQFLSFIACRYEDRQTEPKDRDLSKTPRRNLQASTYDRIGSVTDGVSRYLSSLVSSDYYCSAVVMPTSCMYHLLDI